MNPLVPLLIGGAALLALGGAGGGGTQGASAPPQRVPSVPPAKPPTPKGEERNNDEGRAWGTFYANRDEKKHWELPVFSVASSQGNAAIGTGKVIADVYITIVANADWQWHGQVCSATRWELLFTAGHLQSFKVIQPSPTCQTVRPIHEVLSFSAVRWVQVGPKVILVADTRSGINKLSPDALTKPPSYKPGRYGGTGEFYDRTTDPQWDNELVASGYVTLDASWIFNPA